MGDTYWMLVGGGGRGDMHVTVHGPYYGIRSSGDLISLTRGTSGLLLSCSNFQSLPRQLLIGSKKVLSWLLIG